MEGYIVLLKMLGTLQEEQKADWKSYIASLVQAYNSTKSDATGFTPHYLMFGWHPKLSVDVFFGLDQNDEESTEKTTYVKNLKNRMKQAYKIASAEVEKNTTKNKKIYDKKVRESKLEIGDRVLIRNVGLGGKQKLADKWGKEPYLIVSIPNSEVPVYKVKLESGKGSIRTLHRNLMLPFTSIPPVDSTKKTETSKQRKHKQTQRSKAEDEHKMTEKQDVTDSDDDNMSSVSDSSDCEIQKYVIPQQRNQHHKGPNSHLDESKSTSGLSLQRETQQQPSNASSLSSEVSQQNSTTDQSCSNSYDTSRNDISNQPVSNSNNFNNTGSLSDSTEGSGGGPELSQINNQPRKSNRQRKPPDRFGTWVYSQNSEVLEEVFV